VLSLWQKWGHVGIVDSLTRPLLSHTICRLRRDLHRRRFPTSIKD
jgi:hypothetical protein